MQNAVYLMLGLPRYHLELNIIELACVTVKNRVAHKYTTFKLDDAQKVVKVEFNKIGSKK